MRELATKMKISHSFIGKVEQGLDGIDELSALLGCLDHLEVNTVVEHRDREQVFARVIFGDGLGLQTDVLGHLKAVKRRRPTNVDRT